MPISLRHLRYLLAVADEGNLTRAAERLGLQQPPLTRQIRDLEAAVGQPLFERLPRGMRLTAAGEAVAAEARELLARVGELPAVARRAADGEIGNLRIGYTSSAAFHPFVLPEIRAFSQSTPGVRVHLEEASTAEQFEGLVEGRLDAAFLRAPVAAFADLIVLPLLDEDMVLAAPTDHPLAGGSGPVRLEDLADETFVLYRRASGPGLYDLIMTACQAAGFHPRVAQEAPRMPSTLSLVAAGLGVSLVPAAMERMNVAGVVLRPLAPPGVLRAPILLATPRRRTAVAERFCETIVAAAQREAARPGG